MCNSRNIWAVYTHTSPSGKVYVGISSDIKKRWSNNGRYYCTYDSIFKNAIVKYGWDNIKHEIILEKVSKSEANYAEKYLIKWYKLHNISYNITDGGEGTSGRILSEETKRKISDAHKGMTLSEETKAKIKIAHTTEDNLKSSRESIKHARSIWTGSHHTEETKLKLSEKAKGRDMTRAQSVYREAHRKKSVPILVIKDGIIIGEYELIADACRDLGLNQSNAYRAKRMNIKVNGYNIVCKN